MSDGTKEFLDACEALAAGVADVVAPKKRATAKKVTGKRAKKAPVSKKRAPKGPRTRKEKAPAKRKAESRRGPIGRPEAERVRNGNKTWGRKLRAKRLALGYTQWQFAEMFNIKQPHMCNLEKGTFKPSPRLFDIIEAKFFRRVGVGKPRKGAPKA